MIGLSLLPTGHPEAFQRLSVRSSMSCYRHFNLPMGRSLGFASTPTDSSPSSDSLSLRLRTSWPLTSPVTVTRRLIMQKARRHPSRSSDRLQAHGFRFSFTPLPGSFSPFPHGTGPLSVSWEYLALPDGAGCFNRDSSGPDLLRIRLRFASLRIRGSHPLRPAFPDRSARSARPLSASYYPAAGLDPGGLGSSAFAHHYRRNHCCSLLLPLLRCFSSRRSPSASAECRTLSPAGSPIRISPDPGPFAPPRSFSQLVTSFFASKSLGIPRAPLFSSFTQGTSRCPVLVSSISHSVNELFPAFSSPEGLPSRSDGRSSRRRPSSPPASVDAAAIARIQSGITFKKDGFPSLSPERRYSSHTFRYGYLVTT